MAPAARGSPSVTTRRPDPAGADWHAALTAAAEQFADAEATLRTARDQRAKAAARAYRAGASQRWLAARLGVSQPATLKIIEAGEALLGEA